MLIVTCHTHELEDAMASFFVPCHQELCKNSTWMCAQLERLSEEELKMGISYYLFIYLCMYVLFVRKEEG